MKRVAFALALLLAVAAPAIQARRLLQDTPTAQYATIAEAAQAANLTTLVTLLSTQGAEDLLTAATSTDFQGIVFAPTDAAFAALNETLNGTLGDLPAELIVATLQYHVVAATEDFPSIDATNRSVLTTLNANSNLTLVPNNGTVYIGGYPTIGNAMLDPSMNVTAARARVYIIDSVLLPVTNPTQLGVAYPLTPAEVATTNSNFTILLQAVLADAEVLALLSNPDAAYTIFAPTDQAFMDYLTTSNTTQDQLPGLLGTETVNRVLKNHVLNTPPILSSALPDSITAPTLFEGDSLTITKSDEGVTVAGAGNTEPANVIMADVLAGKSVIHVVDKVLLPPMDMTM